MSNMHATHDPGLLREARGFLLARARDLEALLSPSRVLRRRLERTEAYRRVDGLDEAEKEPIWDIAGTLDVCFERVLTETIEVLRSTARRPGRRRGHSVRKGVHA